MSSAQTAQVTETAQDDRALLVRVVEEAYHRSTWNDTNLRSSIEGLSADEVGWIPPAAKHNIADIVLHCAYWKYAVRRRVTGDRRHTFPLKGKDWFDRTLPVTDEQWAQAVGILDDEHAKLRDAVAGTDRGLHYESQTDRDRVRQVLGAAMHDVYHTGQVHLIKAMYSRAGGQ